MRATSITKNTDLNALCSLLKHELNALGFITDCSILNSTSIKIGLPMRSFRVDVKRLGYNGRMSQYVRSQKSYVRTDVPTWDQRVEFNDTVNRVFDRLGLQARIVSGLVTVRDRKQGAWDESQWKEQMAHTYSTNTGYYGAATNGYGEVISEVVSEQEAREYCDSDRIRPWQRLKESDRDFKVASDQMNLFGSGEK